MYLSGIIWCCSIIAMHVLPTLASDYSCPTWLFYSNITGQCECGFSYVNIHCDQQTMKVELKIGYCVTYSGHGEVFYGGVCPLWYKVNNTNRLFSELPSDPDLLEEAMCGSYNRKGFQCSECIDGYGPGVYSLDRTCVDCSKLSMGSAICLYLLVVFVPITLFFIVVVVFHINITSGPMLGYVIFSQGLAVAIEHYLYIYQYILFHASPSLRSFLQVLVTIAEALNLRFLRYLIAPFCISEKLQDIHVILFNLLPTIYPILLVIVSLIIMDLHSRNCRIVHLLWKPFGIILRKTNTTGVTSDALIRAFATFVFLSSTMSVFAVYSLTEKVTIRSNVDGGAYKRALYFDAAVKYLSPIHISFLFVTLLLYTFSVVFPSLLLILYPTRVYRALSRHISGRKQLAITAFVESLNGCFKDGLNGTKDYRSFAGVFILFIPLIDVWCWVVQRAIGNGYNLDITFCLVICTISLIISYVKPCKLTVANMSLSFYLFLFGMCGLFHYLWMLNVSTATEALELTFFLIVLASQLPVLLWTSYNSACYLLPKIKHLLLPLQSKLYGTH